jgi:hypothetical protein
MNARMLLVLSLVVVLAWLIPLGGGKHASSAEVAWVLSGSAASNDGVFQISTLTWKVEGVSLGGEYRLENLSTPLLTGSGCCCTYLPCIIRTH